MVSSVGCLIAQRACVCVLGQSVTERSLGDAWSVIVGDMEYAKAYAQSILTMKLKCWNQLPLKLCALAHHDPQVVQVTSQICIDLYDMQSENLKTYHHPLSTVLLDPAGSCRRFVEAMTRGVPLADLPPAFASLIAAFQFIPIAERTVEAGHAHVKKALAKITRAKGARVSLAIRASEIISVCKDPVSRVSFCTCLEEAQQSKKLIANLGIGAHPAFEYTSNRRSHSICETIIYRCDLPAQYFDYSHATQYDDAIKVQRKKDIAKATLAKSGSHASKKITWNDILNNAVLHYLRHGKPDDNLNPQASKPFFSLQLPLEGPHPKLQS